MIDVMFAMVMEQLVHYRKEVIMAHMKETKILLFLRTCLKTSCNLDLINIHLKRQPSMYSDPSQRSKMKLFLKNSQLLPYCFSGQIF